MTVFHRVAGAYVMTATVSPSSPWWSKAARPNPFESYLRPLPLPPRLPAGGGAPPTMMTASISPYLRKLAYRPCDPCLFDGLNSCSMTARGLFLKFNDPICFQEKRHL